MKITRIQLRRIIKEAMMGKAGLGVHAQGGYMDAEYIIVDWADDSAGLPARVKLHKQAVEDHGFLSAVDGEKAADEALAAMLTNETGVLVNGWDWE